MTNKEAKALIGKPVSYVSRYSILPPHHGTVIEVRGKNILIDANWYWLPDVIIKPLPVLDESILAPTSQEH